MTTRRLPPPSLLRPPASDRDLIHLYVDGRDPTAFAALARRYVGLARRAAADVCPAAADDVAQATPPSPPPDPLDELSFREVRAAVAEELARLPDAVRLPLVLCYWESASH